MAHVSALQATIHERRERIRKENEAALFAAVVAGDVKTIEQLIIDKETNVNAVNDMGRRPIEVGAKLKNVEVVDTLALHGASFDFAAQVGVFFRT